MIPKPVNLKTNKLIDIFHGPKKYYEDLKRGFFVVCKEKESNGAKAEELIRAKEEDKSRDLRRTKVLRV